MLLLARKTRRLPELVLGAGSVLICGVGFPASLASGFGGVVGQMRIPLWVASEFVTQVGIVLLYVFTLQVFRPGVGWAKALVAFVGAFLPIALAMAWYALSLAGPGEHSVQVVGSELLVCFAGYGGCFVWSAAESFHQYRMAQRRQELGLADPVVVSRFRLWTCYSLAATGIMAANAFGVLLGHDISTSPVVLVPAGVLGFAASVAMYFVFLPPGWYLRAAARAAGLTAAAQTRSPSRKRRRTADGRTLDEPAGGLARIERILSGQVELEIRPVVVAPEELVFDDHGRHAEDARGDRRVGLLAQPRLGLRLLRGAHQARAVEAGSVAIASTTAGSLTCRPCTQTASEERVDQRAALRRPAAATRRSAARAAGSRDGGAGGFSSTPSSAALRRMFFAIQIALGSTSAGPSWPCASSKPAKSTGIGSTSTPKRDASFGSCVHAR